MSKEEKDLSVLGEFGLIDLITKDIKSENPTTVKGIGDDAAVLDYKDKKTVVTTDILAEGIHFDLIYTPLKHLGYKAVIVNLSDLYAMNAKPQQIVVSLAMSSKFSADMIEELYEGMKLACEFYKVDIVGGDTTSSMTGLVINITAIGMANEDDIVYRSGAKVNDLICVSGDLGAAYMGLQLLEREKKVFSDTTGVQPDLSGYEYLLERQLKPEARFDIIALLKENDIKPTAMIDISDGLSSELLHISKNSETGCNVYIDKIPLSGEVHTICEEFELDPVSMALNGGEDYELLFTVGIDDYEKVEKLEGVTVIGHVTDASEGTHLVTENGSLIELRALGWNGVNVDERE